MAALKPHRVIFVLCALVLLVLPSIAAAQSSTFIEPFTRIGDPGTEIRLEPDPLNPGVLIPITISVGAFVNPCTLENVDVNGSSTISTLQTVDKFGTTKVAVSVRTKGTGRGWTGTDYATNAVFSGATYAFDENQQFSFRLPPAGGEEFTSDFSDKLAMRGAGSIDNWTISATFRIKVNSLGDVQVLLVKEEAPPGSCKG